MHNFFQSQKLLLVALAVLVFTTVPASGLVVGWHDKSRMNINLGDGVLLNQQNQPAPAGAGLVALGNGIALNDGWQSEHVTFAQHTYDLVKTLSVNASVSVNTLFASGNIGFSWLQQQKFTSTNLTFVFTKTRDFGTTLYPALGFCQYCGTFSSIVPLWQNSLRGEGLHDKIASQFGTHYVAGVRKAAWVWVAYDFTYRSASVKRQLTVSASGSSWDSASFSAFVDSFFKSTNTAVSMSCQVQSSSSQPPPTAGTITSFQQFTNFTTSLENYVNQLTNNADAQITGYVLNPIQTVPGYLSMLEGYVPPQLDPADYDDFLQVYTALQVWQQRLASWETASWLNTTGQQLMASKWGDVNTYLTAMGTIANNHFSTGSPLYVPEDAVTYLANLSDLTVPTIYLLDSFEYVNGANLATYDVFIGRVDCGPRALTKTQPFASITLLQKGNPIPPGTNLDYEVFPSHFETNITAWYPANGNGVLFQHTKTLFTNAQWACLTNISVNPDLNGYFIVRVQKTSTIKPEVLSFELTDSSGNFVDDMGFLDTVSGGCGCPDQAAGDVSVSMGVPYSSGLGVVGAAQPFTMTITNQSSRQAHGTAISFALNSRFDYAGASGSQGSGSFSASNRVVSYVVGPLLGGASATINFQLVPLQSGAGVPGTSPVLTVGSGLTNSLSNNVSFYPFLSVSPLLETVRTRNGLQLGWRSDSAHLVVEGNPTLGAGFAWLPETNGVLQADFGNRHFLGVGTPGGQGYFRIQSQ